MSLSLLYDDTISRVRLTCTGLEDGTVTVERSTDQVVWTTVRGGVAVTTVAGVATLDDYEFAADVQNFYRVTPLDPQGGLLLDGVSGNYASTPDDPSLDITGDLDVRADVTPDTWRPVGTRNLTAKYTTTGNQRSWRLALLSTGAIELRWSTDGTASVAATSTVVIPDTTGQLVVRAKFDVSVWSVTFFTGPTVIGPFTQLGDVVTGTPATSIFASTAQLEAGSITGGTGERLAGIIHRLRLRNGIGTLDPLVAQPEFIAQPDGTTSFTDNAGRLWTVNGTARIYGSQTNSITPVLGSVWLKSLSNPALNRAVKVRDWSRIRRRNRSGSFDIVGAKLPVAVSEVRGGREWALDVRAADPAEAAAIDAILDAGDVILVHVPATSTVPGGYYQVEDSEEEHYSGDVPRIRTVNLPLAEHAAPPPEIAGVSVP